MIEIKGVSPGSTGAELELEQGDRLLAVNGQPLHDLIDYQIHVADQEILLEVEKKNGELWDLEIEKDAGDMLGLHFEHPEPTQCGNNCIFCFVHQLPRGLRPTLYLKDEDYRYSFLYGSYITLTNLDEENLQRIIRQKLSPLYVSVHATEEELRTRILGRRGPPVLDLLRRLTAAGIAIHTQIVLCPGVNDGIELQRTIEDLFVLHPGIRSLAVVPVGLTGYRQRLPELRPLAAAEAANVVEQIHACQQRFLTQAGSRFVFAADEIYLQAGRDFPPLTEYEDLPQLENGVGMVPLFRREAAEVLAEAEPLATAPISVITGMSALAEVRCFASDLTAKTGVRISVHAIRNDFFGGHVTVTGLLAGKDILAQLRGLDIGKRLLVPDVMLKEGENIFLDDLSLDDLEGELKTPVRKIGSTPWSLLEALEELAAESPQGE